MKKTAKSMAVYAKKDLYKRACWYVNEETLAKYGLQDLPLPNPFYHAASPVKVPTPGPPSKSKY